MLRAFTAGFAISSYFTPKKLLYQLYYTILQYTQHPKILFFPPFYLNILFYSFLLFLFFYSFSSLSPSTSSRLASVSTQSHTHLQRNPPPMPRRNHNRSHQSSDSNPLEPSHESKPSPPTHRHQNPQSPPLSKPTPPKKPTIDALLESLLEPLKLRFKPIGVIGALMPSHSSHPIPPLSKPTGSWV